MVVADFLSGLVHEVADGFEEAESAHANSVGGVDRHVEGDADMGLCAEVVDLVWFDIVHDLVDVVGVAEVSVVEFEFGAVDVRVLVDFIESFGVEGGGAADHAVDFVAFGEEELGEV